MSSPTLWGWRGVVWVCGACIFSRLKMAPERSDKTLCRVVTSDVMPRPAEVPGKPATERVTFRANADLVAFMDTAKGTRSRGGYLRDLVRADAKKRRSNR